MVYQVTARKYRPQTFEGLTGQDHVRRTLQNALRKGRIAHAYIFSGPRGVGKTTVARLLAKAVNCEVRAAAEAEGKPLPVEPCDRCSSCLEIIEDRHPDVLEIDGASNTGVDHIRDLREQVRYAPARGRRKVYVIDEVHMLSKGAFNALLKTLEEPPEGVIFIFATTEPERIPATISSRCQCFDFHRLPPGVIIEQLARIAEGERIDIERDALHLIARTADGSMRDAQNLFDQVIAYMGGEERGETLKEEEVSDALGLVSGSVIRKVADMIAREETQGLLEAVRDIFREGQDLKQFCISLMGFFRDLLVAEMVSAGGGGDHPDPSGLLELTPEEARELTALAKTFGRERLHRCFRIAMDLERDVRLAASPQPVLEMSLLRMAGLRPSVSLEAVMKKLGEVETALGGSGEQRRATVEAEKKSGTPSGGEEEPAALEDAALPPPGGSSGSGTPNAAPIPEPDGGGQGGLWQRLLHEVEQSKKAVLHYLEGGNLLSTDRGEVKIGVIRHNLQRAQTNQTVIMEAVRRIWGEGNKVVLVPVAEAEDAGPAGGSPDNGVRAAGSAESGTDPLKLMGDIFRDADEIFGDTGDGSEGGGEPPDTSRAD
ncbi:MAG: DNA polymerase III subunit gamma/tau [Nitrospinota bacterium]|nr:DNA polymerase III subunit gamma/tau [Nitrospinota bacterium]